MSAIRRTAVLPRRTAASIRGTRVSIRWSAVSTRGTAISFCRPLTAAILLASLIGTPCIRRFRSVTVARRLPVEVAASTRLLVLRASRRPIVTWTAALPAIALIGLRPPGLVARAFMAFVLPAALLVVALKAAARISRLRGRTRIAIEVTGAGPTLVFTLRIAMARLWGRTRREVALALI